MRMRATNISGRGSARLSVPQAGKLTRNVRSGGRTAIDLLTTIFVSTSTTQFTTIPPRFSQKNHLRKTR